MFKREDANQLNFFKEIWLSRKKRVREKTKNDLTCEWQGKKSERKNRKRFSL